MPRTACFKGLATLKRREVLAESPTELLIYDQIHTPVVSDRDYVIKVTRTHDAARERTEFRCTSEIGRAHV